MPESSDDETAHEMLERHEQAQQVREAVAGLKRGPRAVVRRFALAEVPMEQVAREQRVPVQTAYARLYAAHAALRATLSP